MKRCRAQFTMLLLALAQMVGRASGGEAPTVVFLGDSITKGVRAGVAPAETFAAQLEQKFPAGRAKFVNLGVGGETTAGALARFDEAVPPLGPKVVVVMYGTNDCYVDPGRQDSRLSLEAYRANLEKLIARIRAAGAEPVLMTEPCYAQESPANGLGEHGNVRLEPYMRECRQVAARRDVPLVDNFTRWIAARQAGQRLEEWTTDGYHPNPRGHTEIAAAILETLTFLVEDLHTGPVDFAVTCEELLAHDDRKFLWYHPRAVVFPNEFTRVPLPVEMITLQRHLLVSDHYDGLATMFQGRGDRWSEPKPVESLAWRKDASGATVAVCDVTPGFHEPHGKVIALGAKIQYNDAGAQLTSTAHANEVAYAVYTPRPDGGSWSEWLTLELPGTDQSFDLATSGCAQWLVDADGTLLVPVYHKGLAGDAYAATVFRCKFDGERLSVLERGATLVLNEVRGLCEPSLARFRGRYWLTLRNDLRGYVTASDDGLNYGPLQPWQFDDGSELGSYNTQQHWLVHSGGLFLVYTRRGADNDHIIRHRAPLFMARIDPETRQVVRASERVVIPERGGELGNFGANPVNAQESWITVGEGVWSDEARQRGARGSVFLARVRWSKPNRLRGGSGPGLFVDRIRGW